MNILDRFKSLFKTQGPITLSLGDLDPSTAMSIGANFGDSQTKLFDGEKFEGGFGTTSLYEMDYWELREKSKQLFTENLYARGLIRRLVTNVINTGLQLEATPEESLLGFEQDALADWSEDVENRFRVWSSLESVCDYRGQETFGVLQSSIRRQAMISGDVLVVVRTDRATGLPQVQVVAGETVQTPLIVPEGKRIQHGVELDDSDRHVAYWISQADGTSKRLKANGTHGRKKAWLAYGTDRLLDSVRGEPLLSIILQSLKEVDRYRDSAQRKAVVNSIIAAFIKKGENKISSLPVTGGATRVDATRVESSPSATRSTITSTNMPGMFMQELQQGEEPVFVGGQGTDVNFPVFEEAILRSVAWANEMPPEILLLAFSNNYSASQAAINEFKIFLNKERTRVSAETCKPIYQNWLLGQVLRREVEANGFLEAWRDRRQAITYGAWVMSDWSGAIKPSTDIVKQAKGSKLLLEEGLITRDRCSKELTGTKYSKNVKKLRLENIQLAEAIRPLLELRAEFGEEAVEDATSALLEGEEIQATRLEELGDTT